MTRTARQYYEFGDFRIDVEERLLLRDGQLVPLTPKVFDTLLVLVENSGHILSKGEVMKAVWPDSIVEEANLTKNISTLVITSSRIEPYRSYWLLLKLRSSP